MPLTESGSRISLRCKLPTIDWALAFVVSVYLVAVIMMWWAIHGRTGEISYPLDDVYIHGTLAKNIVSSGTFGIIPGEFSAASSSPLYTVLLALVFLVTGPEPWIPAVLATLFGALTLERANALLKLIGIGSVARMVVGIMIVAYAPLLPIVSTGMEHTLHAWTMVGLFTSLIRFSREPGMKPGAVFIWAMLAAGARYESLFALPPLLFWLALRRNWTAAFALGTGMALPGVAFAAYSMSHGGYALPNSLMLKGNLAGAWKLRAFQLVSDHPYLIVLIGLLAAAAGVGIFNRKAGAGKLIWLPVSVIAMILIHLQLAQLGWFYRYEGYLIILGLAAATPLLLSLRDWLRGRPVALSLSVYIILGFTTLPLVWRSRQATGEIVHATGNIHDQQRQMAIVTRHLGKGARVAVNDLGAVSFLSDAHVLDLYGLGDNSLARAKHDKVYGADCLRLRLEEERTDFVICYPAWFTGPNHLPATLIPVETWILGDNRICSDDTVVFYATSQEAAGKLAAALEAYRSGAAADPQSTNRMHPASAL